MYSVYIYALLHCTQILEQQPSHEILSIKERLGRQKSRYVLPVS